MIIIAAASLASTANSRWVQSSDQVQLQNLDLSHIQQGWGEPNRNKSVDGTPLKVAGTEYKFGIGTHAVSHFFVSLKGKAERLTVQAGADDASGGPNALKFEIVVDGKVVAHSKILKTGDAPASFDVSLKGAKLLELRVLNGKPGIDYDHADWLNPVVTTVPGAAQAITAFVPPPLPKPKIAENFRPQAEIHGPTVVGCSPNKPFLYRIPASGDRPMRFWADHLPAGLKLDASTGIITGKVEMKGIYHVVLHASNRHGRSHRPLAIKADGLLALTPPMGWNSWNVWAGDVDQSKMEAAAKELIETGLANFGYDYVNIDDTWEAGRDSDGNVLANKKFPSMTGLTSYVHDLGLKVGLYSSPGPKTCAGYTGSYQHELQDADQYAAWGFDFLKYDWCSYGEIDRNPDLAGFQKPYIQMSHDLRSTDRDIVFSLCQYGMGKVWNWGRKVGGNLWRTTGDINDTWSSMSANCFGASEWAKGAGPGGWNDPDMLIVGKLGWGGKPRPTRLTPTEQVTHISMWSLLSAPLILGCDLTQIDHWTIQLLTNPEVIDVDQDALGRPATRISTQNEAEVWARPLSNGDWAVGLVNRGETAVRVKVDFKELGGMKGRHMVRNLWLRENIGTRVGSFAQEVQPHGTVFVRIRK